MTVAAIDPVAADMALVAELDRLFARDVSAGDPRRPVHFGDEHEQAADEKHCAENADSRDRIGARMKDLRHRSSEPERRMASDRMPTR